MQATPALRMLASTWIPPTPVSTTSGIPEKRRRRKPSKAAPSPYLPPGIEKSVTATSTGNLLIASTNDVESSAPATTVMPGSLPSASRTPARMTGWSSAMTMRMFMLLSPGNGSHP
ncbi:hypothetical protein G6F57_015879 [Rhizopus arrhizus]|nr:hypothetical protein G6F57_015879 [Rhizopus arrhizus]